MLNKKNAHQQLCHWVALPGTRRVAAPGHHPSGERKLLPSQPHITAASILRCQGSTDIFFVQNMIRSSLLGRWNSCLIPAHASSPAFTRTMHTSKQEPKVRSDKLLGQIILGKQQRSQVTPEKLRSAERKEGPHTFAAVEDTEVWKRIQSCAIYAGRHQEEHKSEDLGRCYP